MASSPAAQFQNCAATAAFTGTPAITVNGGAAAATASTENLYFHRDAFALAFVDLRCRAPQWEASKATTKTSACRCCIVTQ